ncbi:MAG TPA: radical SAM protein [Polyangiaceae bacterium]|nr:radical SAM protein [Polyangiaceae bacterium]
MLALQATTPESLASATGIAINDARKIVAAVHRGEWPRDGEALAGRSIRLRTFASVRRVALQAVGALGHVPELEIRSQRRSALDPFVKVALVTADGHVIEAVRIPLERAGRFSACVSSQAGCALGCLFCATGRLGLARNLLTWEIVEQARVLRCTLRSDERLHGVVFQGMGEPLANVDRVVEAIRVMSHPCALAIDARAITVCTAGLPSGIRKLARDVPNVRLGLSIASARRDVRRTLMPIDSSHSLEEVMDAVEEHARVTGRSPMWAVTPLAGVSDTEDDARALAALALGFEARTGIRPRLSIVPYNRIDCDGADPFRRGDPARFIERLVGHGVRPHLRYSGGADMAAACGQLSGRS